MWADPNLNDFHGRVRRIERMRRKGYGFEAAGTLGLSSTYRRQRSWGRMARTALVVLALGFTLKGAIHFTVGAETYDQRVTQMAQGTGVDPVAATLMAADPVTRGISAFLGEVFPAR